MRVKDIIFEDFVNYKEPSMFISTTKCDFKCCKEAGNEICQNMSIVKQPDISISEKGLVKKYLDNPISRAIVFGGLEPLLTFEDIVDFATELRKYCSDTIVIYTGYNEDEVEDKIEKLKRFKNIIVKFGRFVPDQEEHFDEVLGVNLASPNQYAKKIS